VKEDNGPVGDTVMILANLQVIGGIAIVVHFLILIRVIVLLDEIYRKVNRVLPNYASKDDGE